VPGGAPAEDGARAASLERDESGGSGAGLVRAPIEPSGRSTAREGRWIFKVGPERERDIGTLDDGPDTGARAFGPCGLSAGVTGAWSDEEELRSQVGTGTESPFGPT